MTVEQAFKAGWSAGYSDGGEHDCRMFTPTADRAWDNFQHRQAFEKLPLAERAKTYRCPSCLGAVILIGSRLHCKARCVYGRPYRDPLLSQASA